MLNVTESSDDDKITQYKWEEVKGPLNDKNKMMSSGADSPVLQLKSLVPGIYTFKDVPCHHCLDKVHVALEKTNHNFYYQCSIPKSLDC